MSDLFTEHLSAYLDGELDELRRRRLEAHLGECRVCASALADLRAIVAAAPGYQGRAPARDLWPAIRAGLGRADVVPIATGRASTGPRSRRFSWPQLIAASFLMALLGAGGTWLALNRTDGASSTDPGIGGTAKTVAYAESQYETAIADLSRILEQGRGNLDTATARVIDESLQKIDAAIAEARAALQRDTQNGYLNRQVTANMRRKLTLLRLAADAIART